MTTTTVSTSHGPIKAIHIQVPVGIPTPDGGLEIPNRVFLGGIPMETTELELELFFSDFGSVKDVRIVTDRVTGECKGYGFVTFDEHEDVSTLFRKKTIIMKGRKLRVRKAVRRNGSQFTTDSSPETSPVSKSSPQRIPQVSSPMSTLNGGGQYYFIPTQPPQHHPIPMNQQPSPQQFGYQQCAVTHQAPVSFPTSSSCGVPPLPSSSMPLPPSNMHHPVFCYPYLNAPPMQIPVNWPVYHQI